MISSMYARSFVRQTTRRASAEAVTNTGFRQRVETHLFNNRNGQAYRSTQIHHELRKRDQSNIKSLTQQDPIAEARYLVAMASLNYDGQARMAASIFTSQKAVSRIYAAQANAERFQTDLDAINAEKDLDANARSQKLVDAMQRYSDAVGG